MKEKWLHDEWPDMCKRFSPENIYNADETALYFRMLGDRTLAFSDDKSAGGKKNKERVTILLCCNMSGSDKLKPFLIGKSGKPRCFRGLKVENLVAEDIPTLSARLGRHVQNIHGNRDGDTILA